MDKLEFWNQRASLGFCAGTNDYILKQLEINAISRYIRDGMRILDFGCGNGITMIDIAKKFDVQIIGIDFSSQMIEHAQELARSEGLSKKLSFLVGNEESLSTIFHKFDLVYSERALINIDSWKEQKETILKICSLLNSSGKYVMCESSMDGLEEINCFRQQLNLEKITPPWHNKYFFDKEIAELSQEGIIKLEEVNNFSSTYYFISRVINAALSREKGEEPTYHAPINQLAFHLSPIGVCAQSKIWVWSKS